MSIINLALLFECDIWFDIFAMMGLELIAWSSEFFMPLMLRLLALRANTPSRPGYLRYARPSAIMIQEQRYFSRIIITNDYRLFFEVAVFNQVDIQV